MQLKYKKNYILVLKYKKIISGSTSNSTTVEDFR